MTFNENTPHPSDKLRVFPGDVTTNMWPRLKTMINADHQFNNSAASNDGYHKVSRWVNQSGALGDNTPANIASTAQFYTKSLVYKKQTGDASTRQVLMMQPGGRTAATEEVALGAAPIRAAVSVTAGGQIEGSAFNVSSVAVASQAITITFVEAMPLTTYLVIATGGVSSAARPVFLQTTAKTTATCTVQYIDPQGAGVTAPVDIIVLGGWATS